VWEYPTWRPRLRWRRRVTCVALPTRGSTPGNSSSTDYIGCKTPTTINTLLGNYSYSHARSEKLNEEEAIPSPYPPLSLSVSQGCICQISLGGSKFWLLKSTTVLMHRYIESRPPLAFLIAAGGSEIFAGGSTPRPPSNTALPFSPFPLEVGPIPRLRLWVWGALRLPQWVRAEPGCQTHLGSRKRV